MIMAIPSSIMHGLQVLLIKQESNIWQKCSGGEKGNLVLFFVIIYGTTHFFDAYIESVKLFAMRNTTNYLK